MWRSQESSAIKFGLAHDYYWGDITPATVQIYAKAYQEKIDDQVQILDATNHILGLYIRSAFSDVMAGKKTYPEQPVTAKRKTSLKRVYTKEETEALIAERRRKRQKP